MDFDQWSSKKEEMPGWWYSYLRQLIYLPDCSGRPKDGFARVDTKDGTLIGSDLP